MICGDDTYDVWVDFGRSSGSRKQAVHFLRLFELNLSGDIPEISQ
jgi:hypothetical protein